MWDKGGGQQSLSPVPLTSTVFGDHLAVPLGCHLLRLFGSLLRKVGQNVATGGPRPRGLGLRATALHAVWEALTDLMARVARVTRRGQAQSQATLMGSAGRLPWCCIHFQKALASCCSSH